MAKKNSTQVIEFLQKLEMNQDDGTYHITDPERNAMIVLLKRVDQRDEQKQKPRKKAKKATR